MLTIVRRTAVLWWQTWPLLVAIWLIGWLLRHWLLQLAVLIGSEYGNLWAYLVLPLAPLIRMATYLTMFLLFRSVTPGLRDVTLHRVGARGLFDIVIGAMVPFLVIYTTWKLVQEDYFVYLTSVQYQVRYESTKADLANFLSSDGGASLWIVIAVAFLLRQVITRLRDRLPRWTLILAAYLDAVWLFLTLSAAAKAVIGSPQWISDRRIVVWFTDTRQDLVANLGVLGQWWNSSGAVLVMLISVVGLSMAWLAVASVVYGTPFTPTWEDARRAVLGERVRARISSLAERGQPAWQRIPNLVRVRVVEVLKEQIGRFGPIVDAGRLIAHGGAVPVAFFIAAYAALTVLSPSGAYFSGAVTDGYLWRWVALAVGPHEWVWWEAYRDTIRVVIGAIVDPVRAALVTATFWYCIEGVRQSAGQKADHPPA
ncbi:MAG: hypothetical protein K0R33_3849 [Mycobacterium sp.]|jgi:hypothetical protein|nr:hypothetical protein [Mycobacterium sp.]